MFPKRILVMSPHPDDDGGCRGATSAVKVEACVQLLSPGTLPDKAKPQLEPADLLLLLVAAVCRALFLTRTKLALLHAVISMGGTLIRMIDQGHEVRQGRCNIMLKCHMGRGLVHVDCSFGVAAAASCWLGRRRVCFCADPPPRMHHPAPSPTLPPPACKSCPQVHVAYQTSGEIAVWDADAVRFADFAVQVGSGQGSPAEWATLFVALQHIAWNCVVCADPRGVVPATCTGMACTCFPPDPPDPWHAKQLGTSTLLLPLFAHSLVRPWG